MIGMIMMESTIPAVNSERPLGDGAPKIGMKPRWACSQTCTGCRYDARYRPPHSPNTTDGTAASRSIT